MLNTKLGVDLHPDDKRHVLSAYVHRYTRTNVPQWAQNTNYRAQFECDHDWLCNTEFYVRKDGRLDRRYHHCISKPTWPEGKGINGRKGIDY